MSVLAEFASSTLPLLDQQCDVTMLRAQIPRGTRIFLQVMAAKKRRLEERLLTVFFRWGFQEVVTPSFEYMDVFTLGLGAAYQEQLFKLEERRTGRLLALR